MKIAVIADIHGNVAALKAVLKELDSRGNIESIYCLGDMIAIGPDTNEVLELLFSRKDVSMITGNHDEAVLAILQGKEYPVSHFHVKEHHQWIAERIDNDLAMMLDQLPRQVHKCLLGKSVLFTHYHIEPSLQNQHISKDPFSRIVDENLHKISSLFANYQEELICFGHHHPIHFFQNEQTIFLNPGSLGCHTKSTARFAVVTFDQHHPINVRLEEVEYDRSNFLLSYEILQVPERDFILKAFHGKS